MSTRDVHYSEPTRFEFPVYDPISIQYPTMTLSDAIASGNDREKRITPRVRRLRESTRRVEDWLSRGDLLPFERLMKVEWGPAGSPLWAAALDSPYI